MITVLMATHNGARTMPIVLSAYCELQPVAGDWKLVIVDNASTDSTKEIVQSFQSKLPITYVHEPRIGKNFALNTGLESITGDLILLTDDDAVPRPDWLVQVRHIADTKPDFSVFGGVIVPHWEVPPEDWILEYVTYKYSITDPAWEEGPILPLWVYGPNMAIRPKVFEAGHRFDVNLGPRGSDYQQGDETEFLERIARSGFRCWHCKNVVVAHIIRKHQMTKQWLLRRAIPIGRAEFKRDFGEQDLPPALLGVPRYIIREILIQALRIVRVAVSRNRNHILKERFRLNCLIGGALGGRDLYKRRGGKCQLMPEEHA
jgi:glycosyltransferase involved in cell wall biosynthesis